MLNKKRLAAVVLATVSISAISSQASAGLLGSLLDSATNTSGSVLDPVAPVLNTVVSVLDSVVEAALGTVDQTLSSLPDPLAPVSCAGAYQVMVNAANTTLGVALQSCAALNPDASAVLSCVNTAVDASQATLATATGALDQCLGTLPLPL
jgi:hypothetical protein